MRVHRTKVIVWLYTFSTPSRTNSWIKIYERGTCRRNNRKEKWSVMTMQTNITYSPFCPWLKALMCDVLNAIINVKGRKFVKYAFFIYTEVYFSIDIYCQAVIFIIIIIKWKEFQIYIHLSSFISPAFCYYTYSTFEKRKWYYIWKRNFFKEIKKNNKFIFT